MTSIRGISHLIAIVPFQLGFVPHASLVAVMLSRRELAAVMRIDAASESPPGDLSPYAQAVDTSARDLGADSVVLLAFDSPWADSTLDCLGRLVGLCGVELTHVVRVTGTRWRAVRCVPGCCSPTDDEVPRPELVPAAMEYIVRGHSPFESRAAATGVFHERDERERKAVSIALSDTEEANPSALAAAWAEYLVDGEAPSVGIFARLVAGLDVPHVRDVLMSWLAPELVSAFESKPATRVPIDFGECLDALLRDLPRVPEQGRARWIALIALLRWRSGDGNGARLALTEAVTQNDGDTIPQVRLLVQLLGTGHTYDEVVQVLAGQRSHALFTS